MSLPFSICVTLDMSPCGPLSPFVNEKVWWSLTLTGRFQWLVHEKHLEHAVPHRCALSECQPLFTTAGPVPPSPQREVGVLWKPREASRRSPCVVGVLCTQVLLSIWAVSFLREGVVPTLLFRVLLGSPAAGRKGAGNGVCGPVTPTKALRLGC